jgi:hypothetical protein
MVTARKVHRPHGPGEDVVDLGFVGEPDKVDSTVLEQILGRELDVICKLPMRPRHLNWARYEMTN